MLQNHNNPNDKKPILEQIKEQAINISKKDKHSWLFGLSVSFEVVKSLLYFLVIILLLGGAFGGGVGLGYFAYLVSNTDIPDKTELENKLNDVEQLSSISYSNGEKIADVRSDLIRTNVTSENISPLVKQALIATEDEHFAIHKGVVPKAVIRALVSDATGIGGTSGGSTITQQLVKQQVLTSETSYKRKANEIVLSLRVEKFFSKDEIITSYLNVSPFGRNNKGQNIAGVQEAAKGIFNTTAMELSLPQAAFIAGLPQSPITYSPYSNIGELKPDMKDGLDRKNQVLYNMLKEGFITKEQYDESIAYDLTQDFKAPENVVDDSNGYLYDYVYDQAIQVLMPQYYENDNLKKTDIDTSDELYDKYYTIAKRELGRDGYTVQTTIDKNVYAAMQQTTQNEVVNLLGDAGYNRQIQVGSVLMENATGKILGFVAGRDFETNNNNHAFQTRRSPGSTIKPILTYAPAIDVGLIGSESKLSNYSRKFKNSDKEIRNFDGNVSTGFKPVRESLKMSYNVPVVDLYQELLKVANPKDYYDKMNMQMSPEQFTYESLPVGGTDSGPTVLEQTNAFATLANKGQFVQGYAIQKITDNTGKVIYENQTKPVPVFLPATASIMNDMMRDVITSGTGTASVSTLAGMGSGLAYADWVGKTGTSQNYSDYWFIASNPAVTISAWIGYSEDTTSLSTGHGLTNMQIWAYLANAAYQANPDAFQINSRFELDTSVIKAKVSDFTGQKPGSATIEGYKRTVPGKEVTSLWAKNGPLDSQFRFGMGATDAQYKQAWGGTAPKTKQKVPVTPTTPSSTKPPVKEEEIDDADGADDPDE